MNENINLCEILKGHEGEAFYSPAFGKIRLETINDDNFKDYPIYCHSDFTDYYFTNDGRYAEDGELMIFPSKNQRDWNKWIKEQKLKSIPKTWNNLVKAKKVQYTEANTYFDPEFEEDQSEAVNNTLIEKSALALLKIYQLIEIGYGGNITTEEWESSDIIYTISCDSDRTLEITGGEYRNQIAFHTEEQAKEFLSYPENIQLLRDYFMI